MDLKTLKATLSEDAEYYLGLASDEEDDVATHLYGVVDAIEETIRYLENNEQ